MPHSYQQTGFPILIDNDLRARVQRLLSGDHRVHDLDRLFLAQRDSAHERECFREIRDFANGQPK